MRTLVASLMIAATASGLSSAAGAADTPATEPASDAAAAATTLVRPILCADHRVIDQEVPLEWLARARVMPMVHAHAPLDRALAKGLDELAAADADRYTIRSAYTPMRDWLKAGGFAHFQVGAGCQPDSRIADFGRLMDRNRIGDLAKVAQMQFDTRDLPSGREIESGYNQYSAVMEINISSVALEGVYTETLSSRRVVGNGTTTAITGPQTYPLELPNVGVRHLRTNVKVPIGLGSEGPGIAPVAIGPWPRDPRVAWATYRDGMEKLEAAHPATSFVWTTMPIAASANAQRTWFNAEVRAYASAESKILLDLADIESHDPAGHVQADRQGEVLAKDYAMPGQGGEVNADGRRREAKAWWWLMARIAGWKSDAASDSTAQPADKHD
ncbi:MAG: hypothetical protein H0W83_08580 [Planctomycetes bacterium]|nr:hypothetical protein [Planctomycetota bacterium]